MFAPIDVENKNFSRSDDSRKSNGFANGRTKVNIDERQSQPKPYHVCEREPSQRKFNKYVHICAYFI